MPSLAILAVSFLATLTLAASFGGRRSDEYPSLCSSGKYLPLSPDGEHPITSNMTFSLLAVFKDNTKVSQPLVLRSTQPGVDGGVGGWLATSDAINAVGKLFLMRTNAIMGFDFNKTLAAVSTPVGKNNSVLPYFLPAYGAAAAQSYCYFIDDGILMTSNVRSIGLKNSYKYTLGITVNNGTGDRDHFSLCKLSESLNQGPGYVPVYNATDTALAEAAGIDFSTCTDVNILLIPQTI